MSSAPLRTGFIGLSTTGWAATALAPTLLQPALNDRYTLTAVSTTSKGSATASAAKYTEELGHPVKAYFGDSSQIASDPEVDFVAIAVKALYHKSVVLPVIAAKKPFFLEWPAGTNSKETAEIAEAARKAGVRSLIGLQGRQSPVIKKVKGIIDSGKIGVVRASSIIAHVPREVLAWGPAVSEDRVYTSKKENGVTLLTIPLGHQIDTLTHILGDFAAVSATGSTVYPVAILLDKDGNVTDKTVASDVLDHIAFTGHLKSGVLSSVIWRTGYASTKGRRQFLWEIDGEEGSIRLEADWVMGAMISIRDPILYLNGEVVEVKESGDGVNLTSAWTEFAKGDKGEYPSIEDAIKTHRLLDAIDRSVAEGKTIAL